MKLPRRTVNRKKATAEFEIGPEIVNRIPKISDDDRIKKAGELYHRLVALKKGIRGQLAVLQEIPSEPATRHDVQIDAQTLLAGGDIETLKAPSSGSQRSNLLRQLRAAELAEPSALCKLQETNVKVIREEAEKIRDLAEGFETETLRCFEQLRSGLKSKARFYQFLRTQGFSSPALPHTWRLTDIEQKLLFGALGISCLEFYIAERKKHWKFE